HSPPPPLSVSSLKASALAGAAYLDRHLRPDGRFVYLYDAIVDQAIPDADDYSLPRHAGATWFLAQAGAALRDPRFLDDARRALPLCRARRHAARGARRSRRSRGSRAHLAHRRQLRLLRWRLLLRRGPLDLHRRR